MIPKYHGGITPFTSTLGNERNRGKQWGVRSVPRDIVWWSGLVPKSWFVGISRNPVMFVGQVDMLTLFIKNNSPFFYDIIRRYFIIDINIK